MEMSKGNPPRIGQSANGVWLTLTRALIAVLALSVLLAAPASLVGQGGPGTENGEWHYLGGDAAHTRYSPLDQIDASNFEDLEVAWIWRADNFGPTARRGSVHRGADGWEDSWSTGGTAAAVIDCGDDDAVQERDNDTEEESRHGPRRGS